MERDQWYTTQETAEILKVSIWTVREWLRAGKLKGRKVGGAWRISRFEVLPQEPEKPT